MSTIYLSGPMRGMESNNRALFADVADSLQEQGWEVLNPAALDRQDDWEFKDYISRDVRFLSCCDAICLLPGWQQSQGAGIEYRLAKDLGLPITYWHPQLRAAAKPALVGVGGWAKAGKDQLSSILSSQHNFFHTAYASKLKQAAYAALPDDLQAEVDELDAGFEFTWDGAKKTTRWRLYLQRFGTEGIRHVDEDFWVRATLEPLPDYRVVVSDVRFENEFEAIKTRGGTTVWVRRPGVEPANDHISEHELADQEFDVVVDNDGSLEDLAQKAKDIAQRCDVQPLVP